MPDTDLMDRVVSLIKAAPELHDQSELSYPLTRPTLRRVEVRMQGHPEFAEVECGRAHCFASWALILAGWLISPNGGMTTSRDGLGESRATIPTAAEVLGIPYEEAYDLPRCRGLFWNDNTVPVIEAWVAFYKGEIDRAELDRRIEEEGANA